MGASYAVISQDFAKVFIFELHSMIAKPKLTTLGAIDPDDEALVLHCNPTHRSREAVRAFSLHLLHWRSDT